MDDTFLLSNIVPQDFDNNGDFWNRTEIYCRDLTKKFSDVRVISGPVWLPLDKEKQEKFQFGNYNQYYGYRNPGQIEDGRLQYLRSHWFEEREVLDIGCNIGHITISIAKNHNPTRMVGIDIDKKLIEIAQKNVRFYRDTRFV